MFLFLLNLICRVGSKRMRSHSLGKWATHGRRRRRRRRRRQPFALNGAAAAFAVCSIMQQLLQQWQLQLQLHSHFCCIMTLAFYFIYDKTGGKLFSILSHQADHEKNANSTNTITCRGCQALGGVAIMTKTKNSLARLENKRNSRKRRKL